MSLFSNRDDVYAKEDVFSIDGNLFLCKGQVLQLDNVTRVSVGELPRPSLKTTVLLGVVAILCFILSSATGTFFRYSSQPNYFSIFGWVFVALCGYSAFRIYQNHSANRYGMFVELNSGARLIFSAPQENVLMKAMNVLKDTLANKTHGSFTYNVVQGTVQGNVVQNSPGATVESPTIQGNHNATASGGSQAATSGGQIVNPYARQPAPVVMGNHNQVIGTYSWNDIISILNETESKLAENGYYNGRVLPLTISPDYQAAKQAANERSRDKFLNALKRLGTAGIDFFKSVGADVLAGLILMAIQGQGI